MQKVYTQIESEEARVKVRLRELREEAGISQYELAELFSAAKGKQTSQAKISRIETGFVRLAAEDAMFFVQVLNRLGVRSKNGELLTFEDLYISEGKAQAEPTNQQMPVLA